MTYDDLSTNFSKLVYSAYKNGAINKSVVDLALSKSEITQDDYNIITG